MQGKMIRASSDLLGFLFGAKRDPVTQVEKAFHAAQVAFDVEKINARLAVLREKTAQDVLLESEGNADAFLKNWQAVQDEIASLEESAKDVKNGAWRAFLGVLYDGIENIPTRGTGTGTNRRKIMQGIKYTLVAWETSAQFIWQDKDSFTLILSKGGKRETITAKSVKDLTCGSFTKASKIMRAWALGGIEKIRAHQADNWANFSAGNPTWQSPEPKGPTGEKPAPKEPSVIPTDPASETESSVI